MLTRTDFEHRRGALNTFRYFRKAWSRPAAYHLTRMRHARDGAVRLASALWLIENHVPANGAAPSMGFAGKPSPWARAA